MRRQRSRSRSRRKIVCFPCRRYGDEPTQQHCVATFAAAPGAALSSLAAERKPNTPSAPQPSYEFEKLYGSVKAGKDDCATAPTSYSRAAKRDNLTESAFD